MTTSLAPFAYVSETESRLGADAAPGGRKQISRAKRDDACNAGRLSGLTAGPTLGAMLVGAENA